MPHHLTLSLIIFGDWILRSEMTWKDTLSMSQHHTCLGEGVVLTGCLVPGVIITEGVREEGEKKCGRGGGKTGGKGGTKINWVQVNLPL